MINGHDLCTKYFLIYLLLYNFNNKKEKKNLLIREIA